MSEPRYIVRELSGYTILLGATSAGNARLTTDVMVLDSDECYRVVGYFTGEGRGQNHGVNSLDARRQRARELVDALEAS